MNIITVMLWAGLAFAGPAQTPQPLCGVIRETIDAGPYTYVRLAGSGGDQWAAVVKTTLKIGSKACVTRDTVMERFSSKTLGRTFDRVVFGAIENAPAPRARVADADPVKAVSKAPGPDGRTVAEIYAQRSRLNGKPVALRGRVVKFNAQIMGSNWLHLQDGSGTAQAKDNDIAVTTNENASIGDVVTVRGTLVTDKDLGAGYFFPAIIEKASILK